MLNITRRPHEIIDITLEDGRRIEVVVSSVKGTQVNIGITAPRTITVDRHEITERKWRETHPEEVDGNV